MEAAQAFSEKEDECWLNGDGSSTYGGMQGLTQILIDGNHAASAIDATSGRDTYAELLLRQRDV